MATQFEMDCALMAGAAYVSNRPDAEKGSSLLLAHAR